MKPFLLLMTSFLLIICFSCSDVDDRIQEDENYHNDKSLIQSISTDKNLQSVSFLNLPSSVTAVLGQDFAQYTMTGARVSNKYGYEVIMVANFPEAMNLLATVYFSIKGRQLKNDGRGQDDLPEGEDDVEEQKVCFEFIYPISFSMPDGSTVQGDDGHLVSQRLRSWYESNKGVAQKPVLNFPVSILINGERQIVNSPDEMEKVRASCTRQTEGVDAGDWHDEGDEGSNEDGEDLPSDDQDEEGEVITGQEDLFLQFDCFALSFPAGVIMPDGSTIGGEDMQSLSTAVKNWYIANPTNKSVPSFQYPFNVLLDNDLVTVNTKEELRELESGCDSDGGAGSEDVSDNDEDGTNKFDCVDAQANVGDKCIDQNLREGILDRNCSCQVN